VLNNATFKIFTWVGLGLALAGFSPLSATPADARFGLVGTGGAAFAAKFGLSYYTLEGNYDASQGIIFSSVNANLDPRPGFKVVREVAKLNVRIDGLGETNAQFQTKLSQFTKDLATWYALPSWGRGKKPVYQWFVPDANALIHAESLQIVETIRREKQRNPAITGTVWEVGNEPNLFPAILPMEYAAIFANYHRVIKSEDPSAVVAMGAIFMPEISEDLKARFGEELTAKIKSELQTANLYNTMVTLGVFSALVLDVKNTVLSRTLALSSQEYLRQVLDATTARPDLVTVHAYPYDDRDPVLDSTGMQTILDSTVNGLAVLFASKGIPISSGVTSNLWVTEFGNIEQGLDVDQVAQRSTRMIGHFKANPNFGRWFHYKSTGSDDQFALFSSGPAPITRLASEATFSPVDGTFSCSALNAVGRTFWRSSHFGEACVDSVAPPVVVAQLNAPILLNAEGSSLSSSLPLVWAWESGKESGLDSNTAFSIVEYFRDTTSQQPLLRSDSIKAHSLKVSIPNDIAVVWPRVKAKDGQNRETPWSPWKKLIWTGIPPTRILAGPAVGFSIKPAPGGRSFLVMRISLPEGAMVRVQILDSRGRVRRSLFQGYLEKGSHAFPYDGRGERGKSLSGGIYFCRFQANGEVRTIPSSILP
jgi:hypothetical protein